jgi:hypothetical protein
MTNCPAPAPTAGAILEEGDSFISLRWEEVPGAISYEVTTVDLNEGSSVSTNVIDFSEHLESNLEADNDYQFEIRASFCWGGPYGEPLVLRAKTTIIIVDVILQMECEDDGLETIYSGLVSTGDNTNIDISSNDEGCYLIDLSTTNLNPNVDLSLVISNNGAGKLKLSNFLSNASNFQLWGNHPVKGVLVNPPPGGNKLLLNVDARRDKYGDFQAKFTWFEDMDINISYCADCKLIKPGQARIAPPLITKEANDIKIYPNPVVNLLQLQIPKKGLVQVWDLTGRRWFDAESEDNEVFEINTTNWPPGTYILRWNEGSDSPQRIRHFLKL